MKNILVINVIPSGVGGIQTYGKTLEEKLKSSNISVERIETYTVSAENDFPSEISRKAIRVLTNLVRLFKIIEQNKNNKKIIIHAHIARCISFWENSLYTILGNFLDIPIVFQIHNSLFSQEYLGSNILGKNLKKLILDRVNIIIASLNYWKSIFLKIGCVTDEKVVVINNFVTITELNKYKKFNCREMLELPKNKNIILSIGRLSGEKGYKYLIKSIPHVIKKKHDTLFIIIGEGYLKSELKKQIQNLNIGEYVKLVGEKKHDEIPLWLNAADIFVLSSLRETFPMTILEALSSGKPVICTKVRGLHEIINSEDYGLLVEPANPEDLAEKILIALDKEWNEKKIKKYAEQFTWEKVGREMVSLYEKIN